MTLRQSLLVLVSAVLGACLSAVRPPTAEAQSLLLTQDDLSYVGLEVLSPQFHNSSDMSVLTLTWYATVHYKVQTTASVVVEIPYARYDPEDDRHQSTQGDLYIGLEQRSARSGASFELGARFPTTSESKWLAARTGSFSDINRSEAFYSKVFSILPAVNYRYINAKGMGFRLRGAPAVDLPIGNVGNGNVYCLYAAQFIYLGSKAEATLGISGRYLLTVDDANLGERTYHELDGSVALAGTKVRPGFQLRLPLDNDYHYVVDAIFGLQLTVLVD